MNYMNGNAGKFYERLKEKEQSDFNIIKSEINEIKSKMPVDIVIQLLHTMGYIKSVETLINNDDTIILIKTVGIDNISNCQLALLFENVENNYVINNYLNLENGCLNIYKMINDEKCSTFKLN